MAKMGRPKAKEPKSKIVGVRFSDKEYDRLKKYAELHKITITEAVQKGVEILLSDS